MLDKSVVIALLCTVPAAFGALYAPKARFWKGLSGVERFFVFGDSYTTTGFNVTLAQPNDANPLGNPPYPGYNSANGPNWVDYLTTTYNKSKIYTYNLAYGGATVSSELVAPYLPTVPDFKTQVDTEFIPYYTGKNKKTSWNAGNSLFGMFFGINDVGNSYYKQNATLNDDIFKVYATYVEKLYKAGARNFLFLNVPPVDRSPLMLAQGIDAISLEAADIEEFNDRIAALAANVQYTYRDATIFQFNTHRVFNQVLSYPASYPQTTLYKNTTAYCDAYANGTPERDTLNATCGIPVNEYFWLNSLHPTYPMHDVVAKQIATLLG